MHVPVLVEEVGKFLKLAGGGIFFDGTVGLGGHSAAILQASADNYVYGTDKDMESLALAQKNLKDFSGRFTFFHADFRDLESLPVRIDKMAGFLFDLGVSSFQLDNPARGFSYSQAAPLDMRMDKGQRLTAAELVNNYSYRDLCRVLKTYGEFKSPARIVEQIIFHRKNKKIENTQELKEIVRRVCPPKKTMDPLARFFQALRIEVNQELAGLEEFFQKLFTRVKPGARIVIISFHSLEDRIAKAAIKNAQEHKLVNVLTKKPIIPLAAEIKYNIRARSAKLRAAEKTRRAGAR